MIDSETIDALVRLASVEPSAYWGASLFALAVIALVLRFLRQREERRERRRR